MTWLKLTMENNTKALYNSENINSIIPMSDGTYLCHTGGGDQDFSKVKESLEEIEAMLNKNEKPAMAEVVAKDIKRDYIGIVNDTREIEGGGKK